MANVSIYNNFDLKANGLTTSEPSEESTKSDATANISVKQPSSITYKANAPKAVAKANSASGASGASGVSGASSASGANDLPKRIDIPALKKTDAYKKAYEKAKQANINYLQKTAADPGQTVMSTFTLNISGNTEMSGSIKFFVYTRIKEDRQYAGKKTVATTYETWVNP